MVQPVQEKYLRTDLGAGAHCGQVLSSSDLRELVAQAPHAHLLIVDTNIALHQVDVLEYNSPATSLIVIMQTVMQELKHLNGNVHGRIMELIKDPSRSFIFYANELSAFTATSRYVFCRLRMGVYCTAKPTTLMFYRIAEESINDANDRAIVTAASYFQNILTETSSGEVVFITNDVANKVAAQHHT